MIMADKYGAKKATTASTRKESAPQSTSVSSGLGGPCESFDWSDVVVGFIDARCCALEKLALATILTMVRQKAPFYPVIPIFVADRVGPLRIGFDVARPSQVNDSQRHCEIIGGKQDVIAINAPGDDRYREPVQDMVGWHLSQQFLKEGITVPINWLPGLEPLEMRRWFPSHGQLPEATPQ